MKTVFIDIDTQLDFLFPAGALYVPGAEHIAPLLAALTAFAARNKLQIVSTLDTHMEDDPEFEAWKPHCVAGTQGHQKWSQTLASPAAGHILFEKNTIDFFPNPSFGDLLARLGAERFVVYGLVTEYCVRSVAMGLAASRARVELVTDAIKSLNSDAERDVLERFTAKGGYLTTVREVVSALQT